MEDWSKPDKNGIINVPDELDPLVDKIGMQIGFLLYSDKNRNQTICDIVYISQKFFNNQ